MFCSAEVILESWGAYSREGFQCKVVRYVRSIVHQRNIRLEREPWSDFRDGPGSKRDVCEQEQERPQDDGNAYHVDGDVDRMRVVGCIESELWSGISRRPLGERRDMPVS